MAGATVTLNCSLSLPSGITDTPVFQWEGPSGVTFTPVGPVTTGGVVSSNLTLSEISASEAGVYSCTASLRGFISAFINITVQSESTITTFLHTISASPVAAPTPFITNSIFIAGATGNLTCSYNITGVAVPLDAVWTVNGSAIAPHEDRRISIKGISLFFTPVAKSDAGVYTCTLILTALIPYIVVPKPTQQSLEKKVVVHSKFF